MMTVDEDPALHLTNNEKFLVIGICLGFLSLTIIVTTCFVSPYCWLHNLFYKEDRKKRQKFGSYGASEETTQFKLTNAPHYYLQSGKMPPYVSNNKYSEDSTYSSMSSRSNADVALSIQSESTPDISLTNGDAIFNFGQIIFGVKYKAVVNQDVGQLEILIQEVQQLGARPYGGSCDPYVRIQVLKEKGRKRRSKNLQSPRFEFHTKTCKKTQNPLFRERFAANLPCAELKDCSLKLCVFDDERYANDTNLGEVSVPLRDLVKVETGEEFLHTFDLKEPKQDYGEILFGLSYLPTAERLTFNIIKANNLQSITEEVEHFAPYVRVLLIRNGKLLKKKKTSTRVGTVSPSFSESLTFDIPASEMENVVFFVVVSHHDPQDDGISSPESPTSSSGSMKRDRHVGKVLIGSCARGTAQHHWSAMKQSLRNKSRSGTRCVKTRYLYKIFLLVVFFSFFLTLEVDC
ncbi:synaptotagmin-2-like [Limulus polyphemus]|uniref:Synaptotagmin-2-like n=1 Tax=Limulus polyphemus TaxID=6850 RepID=A0ABM1STK7_LIMPO|nr:synaptotagmin-2-like [Limulus polyphemus]